MFEERQAKLGGVVTTDVKTIIDTKGMTAAQKGLLLEQEAEKGLADQLFGGTEPEERSPALKLNSEKEYKMYGQSVGKVLYAGSAPYRVENFFKDLCKDLPTHCDSKQIKKIADHLQLIYNQKLAAEKEEQNGKNKKKKAPMVKGGGGKGYELNNNVAMISDVMGDDYGDYGDEGEGFKREQEAAYDFMWRTEETLDLFKHFTHQALSEQEKECLNA